MKIFVAGSTGVLGRALLPLLIQKGYIVRTIARSAEKVRALELAGAEAVLGDLLSQETAQQLPHLLRGCDAAIHIATAIPQDPTASHAWDINTRLRTQGTNSLLRASLAAGVHTYIQQSIVMAYPDGGETWLDEGTQFDASGKRAEKYGPVITMEDLVHAVSPEQLRWIILRAGYFVGPETGQEDVLSRLQTGRIIVPGDGSNFVPLVHVVDMAVAICQALQTAPTGSTFQIVDEPIRNGDYLDRLADLLGVSHPARDPNQPLPPSLRCSNEAARTVLNWTPRCGIWAIGRPEAWTA